MFNKIRKTSIQVKAAGLVLGAIAIASVGASLNTIESQAVPLWQKIGQVIYTTPQTLGLNIGGDVVITATTTVTRSKDGFMAGGSVATAATTSPVQTLYTHTGNPAMCNTNGGGLTVLTSSAFVGAQTISIGTSTPTGAPQNNLIASSTGIVASTSPDALDIQTFANDVVDSHFLMQAGDTIKIQIADSGRGTTDGGEPTASSTNYASRDIQYEVPCYTLSIPS